MNQEVIRKYIASEIAKRIVSGRTNIVSTEFAEFHNRMINPATMRRYMIGEPLFNYVTYAGTTYPCYNFIWAPREMLSLKPATDWLQVIAKCFTPEILDRWMFLHTKESKTGIDPFIVTHQVMRFKNALVPLRYSTSQFPTEEKIRILKEQIRTFWNVVYGHKIRREGDTDVGES